MRAQYTANGGINVVLAAGETMGTYSGPTVVIVPPDPGNSDYIALIEQVNNGTLVIEPFRALEPTLDMGGTTIEIMGED